MRRTVLLLSTMVLALLLAGGVALAATTPFENSSTITINDSLSPPTVASPYPSQISVQNLSGNITDVDLKLSGYSHIFPDDVGVLVVGPQGQKVLVMSDVGFTHDVSGIDLTFDDEATSSLPDSGQITAGTFKPTQGTAQNGEGRPVPANFPAPAPAGPYGTQLSVFDGTDPNGTWSLYVLDDSDVEAGQIANGWSLVITTADDTAAPSVTIAQASGQEDPTSTSPISFTAVFSEPVTGFTDSDVTLSGTAGPTTAVVSGGPTTFNIAVSGMTSDGTVIASIPANAAQDASSNGNTGSTSTDNTVTFIANPPPEDTTAPKVISTFPRNGGEVGPAANIRATFSEDMESASVINAFKLFKKGSTTQISAQVSYDAATDTATLNPKNNLMHIQTRG
jgi:hypothetical protein